MATEQDSKENRSLAERVGSVKAMLSKLPAWVAYALFAGALLFLLVVAYLAYNFLKDFNEAVSILSDRYGINSWLAKAIAVAFLGPLAWGLRKSFFSWEKRTGFRIATSIYACFYFLTMYWVSLEASFSHKTGETLQWYSETPEGIRFFDSPGYDQKYGIELKPATREIKVALERRKRGQVPKEIDLGAFESLELYDQLTGSAKYWFGITSAGNYALYDGPGIDPKTQIVLRPVTPEVAQDIRRLIQSRQEQLVLAKEAKRQEHAKQQSELRLASLRKLFSCPGRSKKPAAIAIRSKSDSTISDAVLRHLSSSPRFRQLVETDFFRPTFIESAYFDRAFGDDVAFLKEAGAFTCVSSIVIGETESKCGSIVNGVLSCDVHLSYRVISESGARIASGILTATGAGFDIQHATDAGARVLAETKGEELIRAVPSK